MVQIDNQLDKIQRFWKWENVCEMFLKWYKKMTKNKYKIYVSKLRQDIFKLSQNPNNRLYLLDASTRGASLGPPFIKGFAPKWLSTLNLD